MNSPVLPSSKSGFTLIEALVAVTIIVILLTVIGISALASNQRSRDAKRQSDLRMLQGAIELYKNKYGRYPAGCPTTNPAADGWSGQKGTIYACDSGTQYILDLAPEFIPVLPIDKKLNGTNSGYVYRTNNKGTVYKLKAQRTVESEIVDYQHPLKACDIRVGSNEQGGLASSATDREIIGWCGRVNYAGKTLPAACKSIDDQFRKSYAVWGGFEPKRNYPDINNGNPEVVQDTTEVICK